MVDGPIRRMVKALVRALWTVEWGIRRRIDPGPWKLSGTCQSCARCCERPTIRAGRATFWIAPLRRMFLAWQAGVNGFDLVEAETDTRTFHFRCTHFDWATRRCDSYSSRPHMCRDYPRGLLSQPWPELFDTCGHRVLLKRGDGLSAALEGTDLSPEARAELRKKLRLE